MFSGKSCIDGLHILVSYKYLAVLRRDPPRCHSGKYTNDISPVSRNRNACNLSCSSADFLRSFLDNVTERPLFSQSVAILYKQALTLNDTRTMQHRL